MDFQPQPYRRLWQALLTAPVPMTMRELSVVARADRKTASWRIARWHRADALDATTDTPRRYSLKERTPLPPMIDCKRRAKPRGRPAYQRIWDAMRVLKTFDVPLLRVTAEASPEAIRNYVAVLTRCGYVRVTDKGSPRRGITATYRLICNSGRAAPRESHTRIGRFLVDRNSGASHDLSAPASPDGGVS